MTNDANGRNDGEQANDIISNDGQSSDAAETVGAAVKPKRKPAAKSTRPKRKKTKSRGESSTSPRRIKAIVEKQVQALEYRKMGYNFAQIAEVLGYKGAQGAHFAVQSALTRIIREPAEAVLQLELERLDAMFSKPYQSAIAGDLMALNSCLAIMQRKAKYLGLDMAVKVDATVANKSGEQFNVGIQVTDDQVRDAMLKARESF